MIKSPFTKLPNHARMLPIINFMVGDKEVVGSIDTGAVITLIPEEDMPGSYKLGRRIKVISGFSSIIVWTCHIPITIDGSTMEVEVVPRSNERLAYIGLDILEKCRLSMENNTYTLEVIE